MSRATLRPTVRSLMVSALVVALLGFLVEPAAAGGVHECPGVAGEGDARIRKPGKPYKGDGEYVAANQYINAKLDVGETAKFDVRIRNNTGTTEKLVVEGGSSGPYLKLRYFRGDTNITSKVSADGKGFNNIAPNVSTPAVRVKVTLLDEVPGTAVFTHVTGRTADAPTFDDDFCTGDSVLPRVPAP